ncbi:nucleotide sugar dehydrogenase [Streptomyces sp. NPDC058867]|uniref:nucleotide sugar dehydrogenase n=1 Tax=unclassified Streptomyces TaxID=2593676 RepID=UPI0036C7C0B6
MTITHVNASNGVTPDDPAAPAPAAPGVARWADRALTGDGRGPEALRGITVAVVGLGYVGLPTALALWGAGAAVVGVDTSARRIDDIREGVVDLLPAQHAVLACAENTCDLLLTTDADAVREADAVVICVPTPVTADHRPDLTALRAACASVVERAAPGQLIVLTSTSHVGTTRDLLIRPLAARGLTAEREVLVAFAPERIDPGNARHTPENTPRLVGGAGPLASRAAAFLLAATAAEVHEVAEPETAEMAKLWENVFRAVNIALANELSDACLHLGLAPLPVIEAAATKPYGFLPFYPGPGAGGHCIPCDPYYLLGQLPEQDAGTGPEHAPSAPVVRAAMAALRDRPARIAARAAELLRADGLRPAGARVLVLGVAYKEGVSDVRESPALRLLALLAEQGADIHYSDCHVDSVEVAGRELRSVPRPREEHWDLVVLHTAHPDTDLDWLRTAPRVLDTRHRHRPPTPAAAR